MIEIDGEIYDLCKCSNCKSIHATKFTGGESGLSEADRKINCCDEPFNFWIGNESDSFKKFVREFGTKFTKVKK